jgi:hypothetical protein
MPYLAVAWENENSEEAVSSTYEVGRNKVFEYNGAEKSSLPILDIDGIAKGSEASAVFYYDVNAEHSIENTNPTSYMQQDGLFSANPDIVAMYEAKHCMNAVDATKNSEYNLSNKSSDASSIYSINKTDVKIKGAVDVGKSVEKNNKAQANKQGSEKMETKEVDKQDHDAEDIDSDNGVGEITLIGTIFAGIMCICLM